MDYNNNSHVKIPSKFYDHIIVTQGNNQEPSIMMFENQPQYYQSMYDINQLDDIYLHYIIPIILIPAYIKMNKILCIGLGGGHIPLFFSQKFPKCIIDIVEIDRDVYDAAKFMGFSRQNNMNIYIDDGLNFLKTTNHLYDAVIIDLDSDEKSVMDFAVLARHVMGDKSLLVINFGGYHRQKQNTIEKLLKIFKFIKTCKTSSRQYIFLCCKTYPPNFFRKMDARNSVSNMNNYKHLDSLINHYNNLETEWLG